MKLMFTRMKMLKPTAVALMILLSQLSYGRDAVRQFAPPVFWNVFEVNVKDQHIVEITWKVTEYNNKSFYIQHSVNGTDWEDVVFIPSKSSPESMTDYSYTYLNKEGGKHFYRVKQIDIDQNHKPGFSKVRTVELTSVEAPLSITPNPATDHINLVEGNTTSHYTNAQVFDLTGKKVLEQGLQVHSQTIYITNLPRGIYFLKITDNNNASRKLKFIKQ
jgi:hypothetical protein